MKTLGEASPVPHRQLQHQPALQISASIPTEPLPQSAGTRSEPGPNPQRQQTLFLIRRAIYLVFFCECIEVLYVGTKRGRVKKLPSKVSAVRVVFVSLVA